LRGNNFLSAFDKHQLDALVMVLLRLHNNAFLIPGIFWGLWLFPFGHLIYRSGFLPRILGILLFIAGCGYLLDSLTGLLLPHGHGTMISQFTRIFEAGELPVMFWLLILGAKDQPLPNPA
jgi:hypothetical protein